MPKSTCICSKQSFFDPLIVYKNETVFRAYEGAVIGACRKCNTLKTFPSAKNKSFDPVCTKADLYEQRSGEFEKLFEPIVSRILRYSPGTRLLDVGCSSGILLRLLERKKFDVYGIEPNAKAQRIARSRFPRRIHHGTLSSFPNSSGRKFDCIVYNHVMEHIPDLSREINLASRILAPGGILVVGVPNTSNAIFRIRGKYWESLLPNEHIWHMNTKDLSAFLEKHGFMIRDISYGDDPRRSYPLIKQIYFRVLSLINRVFNTGEAVLIIAEKKR